MADENSALSVTLPLDEWDHLLVAVSGLRLTAKGERVLEAVRDAVLEAKSGGAVDG